MKEKKSKLLEGICILDLAYGQGSFCSKLLEDLGATATRVEAPEGDSCRATSSFKCNNANTPGIALNLRSHEGERALQRLIRKTDILVESLPPGSPEATSLNYRRLRRINPSLIHLSITGFGQTGPRKRYRAGTLVHAAFGGQMHVCGVPSGKPLALFGSQPLYAAGLFGANAVLLNLRKRKITGKGCHIDLSIHEAVASTLGHVMIDFFHDGRIAGRRGEDNPRERFSMLRCKDGFIQIPVLRNWETLRELMASQGDAKELLQGRWKDRAFCEKHYKYIVDAAGKWAGKHTRLELFMLGQAMGFPWAPVESPADVLKSPQLKARRFFLRTATLGRRHRISLPGLPYRLHLSSPPASTPDPLLSEHTAQILESPRVESKKNPSLRQDKDTPKRTLRSGNILRGIRVIDFTRMLSGPYATRILGDFGAEVIKIQSGLTSSGAEKNDTPYFRTWNRNKRSITLNLNRPEARDLLLQLASISDVVVENFSPRVLLNWGLTYSRLSSVNPDLIMASISAMGQTGPWKDYVGFAPTFHALSGLISATSQSPGMPAEIGHSYGDVIAGLYAALAILASIDHRDRTGRGLYIDLSAYEALCTLLGEAFIGNTSGESRAAPCGCYPCKGPDRWCVIAVTGKNEWEALCKICGIPELKSARFSTPAQRRKYRPSLDNLIGRWTVRYAAEIVVSRLQQAGIAAGVVQNSEDLAGDSQLAARRFFIPLRHPVLGRLFSDRSALWPSDEKPVRWKAAPLLGEDNHYVFVELLGHSESEFRSLVKSGVIA